MDKEVINLLEQSSELLQKSRDAQSNASSVGTRLSIVFEECLVAIRQSEKTLLLTDKIRKHIINQIKPTPLA